MSLRVTLIQGGGAGFDQVPAVQRILKAAGVDITKVKYVEAGASWGPSVLQGKGDTALSWEGLRAQWKGQGSGSPHCASSRA